MKSLKFGALVVAIVATGAVLVIVYLLVTGNIGLDSSDWSVEITKSEETARVQPVFTDFKSRWKLPELRFMNRKNREITLEAFRGSYVLLNIWATWCAPCREEMPALDRLQEKMGGPDFHVLPLSIDEANPSVIRRFYDDLGIKFLYVYQDPTGKVFWKLKFSGIPATILVDKNGKGIAYVVGPVEWDSEEVIDEIRGYLAKD